MQPESPLAWQELIADGRVPRTVSAGSVPVFTSEETANMLTASHSQTFENLWKDTFKRWPRLYELLVDLIGPSFFTGVTAKVFSRRFPKTSLILHGGAGTSMLGNNVLNVDLFAFPGVHVVADLHALPFRDGCFDAATCDQVLEHVGSPQKVAQELLRVVKPGGLIHIACPFVFPWHPSPSDYSRWTHEGLAALFPGCDIVEQGITAGPCSALTAFSAAFFATILSFGSRSIQGILQYFFLLLFAPLKFLDILFARFPNAVLCAANLYSIVRVPHVSQAH